MSKGSLNIRTAILTVSDRSHRGERTDLSGPALKEAVDKIGWSLVSYTIVPDDLAEIQRILLDWCNAGMLDLILTSGGTGFAPRDVTPEATQLVIERSAPGLAEVMRSESLKVTKHAMLSRAVAGIRGRTLIVNLPGSPKAALENLATIASVIPHAIELLQESPHAEAHH
jgi:molybdopterin adenylyltransferase